MYSLLVLPSHNFGSSLCYNLFGHNPNLGTFLTIDVYFFFMYWPMIENKSGLFISLFSILKRTTYFTSFVKLNWTKQKQVLTVNLWF